MREGYKKTEVGIIPEDWEVKKMKEIILSTELGTNSLGNEINTGFRLLKMGNLTRGGFNFDKLERISIDESDINQQYRLEYGDFLFNTRNTLELVGKYATWKNNIEDIIFNSNIMRIKYNNNVNTFYASYYFESDLGWRKLKSIATGTTSVAAIYTKDLNNVKVILPPLKEQEKIAEILSTVDSQIDDTEKLIEKSKELKKGLMQKLLTKGIGHSEFKKTEVGEIPVSWEVKKFKDVSKINQGLQIAIEDRFKEKLDNRLPYITIQYINDKNNKDNEFYIENANESVICTEDEILMTRTGNTGQVVTNEHGVFHNNFFKIDFDRKVLDKDYLVYYLKSRAIQSLIMRYAGTTTIPDLKHSDFYRIPIVLPSIDEQKIISEILISIDNEIEEYKNKKQKLEELKKGLMQQLLTGKIRVTI